MEQQLLVDLPPPTIEQVIESLPGRELQVHRILQHIGGVNNVMPPLFCSGPPNTGKTSTVLRIFESLNRPVVYVSCAGFKIPPTRSLRQGPNLKYPAHETRPPIFEEILRGMSFLENSQTLGHPGILRKDIYNKFIPLFQDSLERTLQSLNNRDYEGNMVYLIIDHVETLHEWFKNLPLALKNVNLVERLCHGCRGLGVVFISSHSRIPSRSWKVAHRVQFTPYRDHDLWLRQMHAPDLDAAVAEFKDRIIPPMLLGFRCSVHHLNRDAINQKSEGICMAVATAGAMTIAHRLVGDDEDLNLSPQPLIDYGCTSHKKTRFKVTNRALGIQSNRCYHFSRVSRVSCKYQRGRRYHVDGFNTYHTTRAAKAAIIGNFGSGGSRIPMIGGCKMGRLLNSKSAFNAFFSTPFRHNLLKERKNLEQEGGHAVTIMGMDTLSNNPRKHAIIIKNSWGKTWGARGYSKVSFDFFNSLSELILH